MKMDFNGLERYINENLGDENPLAAAGRKEKKLLSLVDEVFNDYIDADEQISYYKARFDRKHFNAEKEFDDDTQKEEDLFNGLADLKMNLKATMENDKSDIEKAKELCWNMKKAAAEVFGHKSSDFQAEEKI